MSVGGSRAALLIRPQHGKAVFSECARVFACFRPLAPGGPPYKRIAFEARDDTNACSILTISVARTNS